MPMPRPPKSQVADAAETRVRILRCAIVLFARAGFDGVSMRDVASQAGLTPASLYYHFNDKESLYLATAAFVFSEDLAAAAANFEANLNAFERLETFIHRMVNLLCEKQELQRFVQWALLETDEVRLNTLSVHVLTPFQRVLTTLVADIEPDMDVYLLTQSIFGLLFFPFEAARIARFLPNQLSPHQQPAALSKHICELLRNGVVTRQKNNGMPV